MNDAPSFGPSWPCPVWPGMVLRHHSGRVYTVLALSNTGAATERFPVRAEYVGANGARWSRDLSEFPGKFTVLFDGTTLAEQEGRPL